MNAEYSGEMQNHLKVTDFFGQNVFDDLTMRRRLPKDVYKKLKKMIDNGEELDAGVANVVASAIKDWAIEKGATHYCHWFQPMTGRTAEKHESFIEPFVGGGISMEFSGKQLIKGEPDASSFPNGGLRATFEARGYTAWDTTSPAFIKDKTLYIPTAFCSYWGEALDEKTPLLRSMQAVSRECLRVLRAIGDTETQKVIASVGAEQEYFLIDKRLYQKRKDLILTGRTLFGANPPKGQEMEDHYFGSIKENIAAFMKELDIELWKMGVYAKIKHNEAAPAQHEIVPVFSVANIAADHNQLVMDTLVKVANHHGLVCLLHPKPFEGINGSGKHCNWSLGTERRNLLEPGETPHQNTKFLLILSAVMAAVDEYAPLLRASISSAANDRRLGGHEAPPAIISIYLGDQLSDIIRQILEGDLRASKEKDVLELHVDSIPTIFQDVTDRNRTSPFAFTGNKFEFRMCSSSASIAGPNITLNTIVAEHLRRIADRLEKAEDVAAELKAVITENIRQHQRIIFDGDGYSREWTEEAKRRGLPILRTSIDAFLQMYKPEFIEVFDRNGVMSPKETLARAEIMLEDYCKVINIEAKTMIEMARKEILPAAYTYARQVAENLLRVAEFTPEEFLTEEKDNLQRILRYCGETQKHVAEVEDSLSKAYNIKETGDRAFYFRDAILPEMEEIRLGCDALEELVEEKQWPFPTYFDLLFRI